MASFGLPLVPPPLKSLSPYLQRADELHHKEPVIAYWCAYYAAQLGISLKAKDNASRMLLLNLLDALEKLKKDIGPNDAIDLESASAAYVENFALNIFSMADEEDRRGGSTRSTAKKFLAAANFLEVLRTFPKTELTETTEDKIRYSKWKAADIAKAFREGRKPTPGGVGEEHSEADFVLPVVPSEPSINIAPSSSPPRSPPILKRFTPPPVLDELPPQPPFTPGHVFLGVNPDPLEPTSPGNWSTVATPGVGTVQGSPTDDSPPRSALVDSWPDSPTPGTKPRRGSQSSTGSADSQQSLGSGGSRRRNTSISPKKVHFSTGGRSALPPNNNIILPPGPEPSAPPFDPPPFVQPSQRLPSPPRPPPISYITPPPPAPIASQQVDLTPSVIAKAQKHCRFAISALDYEDAEQARRELRAALSILGG